MAADLLKEAPNMKAETFRLKMQSLYMKYAVSLASKSPPQPTNFCVGAVLVHEEHNNLLTTGYTLELPGNTHAEQVCFMKFAEEKGIPEEQIGEHLPKRTVLYTTMEPCNRRASSPLSCVDRILATKRDGAESGITKVYYGVKEPDTFVGVNEGRKRLESKGVECVFLDGFQEKIMKVAAAGHVGDGG